MAAPNILACTSATPHTLSITPSNTSRTALVTVPATGAAQKINQIMVSNIDGTTAYDATVEICLADGTTFRAIASTISIPPDASLIVSDKTTMFYLLDATVTGEASTLWATSSLASKLTFTVSYETIAP
jgi:hypothetical protein